MTTPIEPTRTIEQIRKDKRAIEALNLVRHNEDVTRAFILNRIENTADMFILTRDLEAHGLMRYEAGRSGIRFLVLTDAGIEVLQEAME